MTYQSGKNSTYKSGKNFLHTPGPTNIPERVLAAMMRPAVDLSDPDYLAMLESCFLDLKKIFKTDGKVFIYNCNGHGAWEAALVNTLSPGDRILVPETGQFALGWGTMAESLGVAIDYIPGDWRSAIDPNRVADKLSADTAHEIKAVLMVHTDTATSITADLAAIREAIDSAGHPALFMVDTIAALATIDFRMDEWGVDVAVAAGQKGLMQPPGLGFNAVSEKALEVGRKATLPRNYWDWQLRMAPEYYRAFCGTSPEHLLFALREAMDMLAEEGLDKTFLRHQRLAQAVREAVTAWSRAGALEFNAVIPAERSDGVTTIRVADGFDGDDVRITCREIFNVSLGAGLGKLSGGAFRIGHMGYLNEPMVLGALAGVEGALKICGVPFGQGGVDAALAYLTAGIEETPFLGVADASRRTA